MALPLTVPLYLKVEKRNPRLGIPSEANLINGILKVIKDEQKVIRFLEGHGEKRVDDFENQGFSTVKGALEKDGFKVEKSLLLQSGEIPSDTELLVIPGPEKPILPEEQKLIQEIFKWRRLCSATSRSSIKSGNGRLSKAMGN